MVSDAPRLSEVRVPPALIFKVGPHGRMGDSFLPFLALRAPKVGASYERSPRISLRCILGYFRFIPPG
jgi:hypothetical protein